LTRWNERVYGTSVNRRLKDPSRSAAPTRWVGLVVLWLQLLVVGVVPFLDAEQDVRAATQSAHVEETGQTGCAPMHDPAACEVCRALRAPAEAPRLTQGLELLATGSTCVVARSDVRRDASQHHHSGSRAPPAA
jgi:hypothetical protein